MQIIILAGGKGTRMGDLTRETPKPMLMVAGKNLLEHKLDALPREIDEVIIVIGYLGEKIRAHFGDSYKGKKITYIEQSQPLGTAHAVWTAKDHVKGHFIVMLGDDIYDRESIQNMLPHTFAITVRERPSQKDLGHIKVRPDGNLHTIDFDKKENHGDLILMDVGLYKLHKDIFKHEMIQIPGKNEYGLPHTLASIAHHTPIKVVKTDFWIKMNSIEDKAEAEAYFAKKV